RAGRTCAPGPPHQAAGPHDPPRWLRTHRPPRTRSAARRCQVAPGTRTSCAGLLRPPPGRPTRTRPLPTLPGLRALPHWASGVPRVGSHLAAWYTPGITPAARIGPHAGPRGRPRRPPRRKPRTHLDRADHTHQAAGHAGRTQARRPHAGPTQAPCCRPPTHARVRRSLLLIFAPPPKTTAAHQTHRRPRQAPAPGPHRPRAAPGLFGPVAASRRSARPRSPHAPAAGRSPATPGRTRRPRAAAPRQIFSAHRVIAARQSRLCAGPGPLPRRTGLPTLAGPRTQAPGPCTRPCQATRRPHAGPPGRTEPAHQAARTSDIAH
ncbi:translation initiation factor IF-2-like, partial [Homarus americanus]|uniref:translation initiation factor IF-2-like n=1 Tax=Homarus americanus TaxID=6706 RepID=UPI001C469A36